MTYASRSTTPDPTRSAASDVGDNVQALRDDIASLAASVKRLAAEQIGTSVEDVQDKAMEKVGDIEAAIAAAFSKAHRSPEKRPGAAAGAFAPRRRAQQLRI